MLRALGLRSAAPQEPVVASSRDVIEILQDAESCMLKEQSIS